MKNYFKGKKRYIILTILAIPIVIFFLYIIIIVSAFAFADCNSIIAKLNFQNEKHIILHEQTCFVDPDEDINGVTWNFYKDGIFHTTQVGRFIVGTYNQYPEYKNGRSDNFFGPDTKITLELNSGDKYCYVPYKNTIEPWSEDCTWEAMRKIQVNTSTNYKNIKKEIPYKYMPDDVNQEQIKKIKGGVITVDANVYIYKEIEYGFGYVKIESADPTTFQFVGNCSCFGIYCSYYFKDKNSVYLDGVKSDIDTNTFEYYGLYGSSPASSYAKDKDKVVLIFTP